MLHSKQNLHQSFIGLLRGLKPMNRINLIWLGLLFTALPIGAEDPLLGQIKVIKCVGCVAGKVTLVIHDPIDVREFEVTISDTDYGKIISPLPGKVVYEGENNCFYWNETPKVTKKVPPPDSAKPEVNPALKKPVLTMKNKKEIVSKEDTAMVAQIPDSTAMTSAPLEIKRSKCIPFEKVALPKVHKPD
jgi:hypothetical protein